MILRPVRPASPNGPPITKRPVGLTKYLVFLSRSFAGSAFLITSSITASLRSLCFTSGAVLRGDHDRFDALGVCRSRTRP